ncbi:DUF4190 domain-containing protein [Bacillus sp. OK048]|uniref:DUF4190 domain-containing protein n=1 Tax=Bacillus sp. OK048 TaxID=1882761 RepID=UPI00088D0236|nr:DUF4190 domain-containing protein [Bacillus sp. OK048]SDN39061.1 protein of unknown function [Bacillus sp. OK048]
MLKTQVIPENKGTNGKAVGSLLIGILSIFGIFFIGYGAILSVAGLLLGIIGLRETKKLRQKGRNIAMVGIIFNCLGIFSLFF